MANESEKIWMLRIDKSANKKVNAKGMKRKGAFVSCAQRSRLTFSSNSCSKSHIILTVLISKQMLKNPGHVNLMRVVFFSISVAFTVDSPYG